MSIHIKPVKNIEECEAIMHISAAAWGSDLADSVPSHTLWAIAKNKGVVLMAWDGEKPVGFCFSFLAYDGRSLESADIQFKHYSHQAGVLPEYQGHHLGEQLKWAQRQHVLTQGVARLTWTYDPLQTLNGNLNLRKLGAICRTYFRNYYGMLDDPLNKGVATDRFEVDWWLSSGWVEAHAAKQAPHPSIEDVLAMGGSKMNDIQGNSDLPQPKVVSFNLKVPYLLVAVPRHFQKIKQQDSQLAAAWRIHTRDLFEQAFSSGYTAVDLLLNSTHCCYLLQKDFVV